MTSRKYFLLYLLPILLYLGCPVIAHAYLTNSSCEPHKDNIGFNVFSYNSSRVAVKSTDWNALLPGQYLYIGYSHDTSAPSEPIYFKLDCPNLGPKQAGIEVRWEVTGPSSAYTLVQESSIIRGTKSSEENKEVAMYKTTTPGVYYAFMHDYDYYVPIAAPMSGDYTKQLVIEPILYITKDYKWGAKSPAISLIGPVSFKITDGKDGSRNANDKGYINHSMTSAVPIPAEYINIEASCNYSLSKSTIDFGDNNISKLTSDKNTTVKQSITLNMKDCYGVNKVKTYITNTTNTLENGLLLDNNSTTNAATNVGIGMSVGSSYNENKGKDFYMDGTHPLEWNFDNALDMTSKTKEIPLDVFLLKSGGTPTTGDFEATATIMLDFI